ncbi:MAG: hypothetical protein GXP49_03890 [Deltaproteobacteria bacterium]|nr:hypothetical protein [Deltaproteobacteria bacterium]
MKLKHSGYLVLALAGTAMCLAPLSCGGDDNSSKSISLDDVPDLYYDAFCTKAMECPVFFNYKAFSSVAECKTLIKKIFEKEGEGVDTIVQAAEDGNSDYDGNKARKCLDAIKAATCEQMAYGIDMIDPSCTQVFKGKLDDGVACRTDQECSGGWCDGTTKCDGKCKQAAGEGEDCASTPCKDGLVCSKDGKCTSTIDPPGEGEDCANYGISCKYGLFCNNKNKCEKLKGEGEECLYDNECVFGFGCFSSDGGNTRKCQKPEIVGEGKDCDWKAGKVCDISKMLFCGFTATDGTPEKCHKAGQEGDTCFDAQSYLMTQCDPYSKIYCDAMGTNKCVQQKKAGEACNAQLNGTDCLSGTCGQDGKCAADPCADK